MDILSLILRKRYQALWSNPKRKIQTLESFSQTEIDAGKSILQALKNVKNSDLRTHLKRHASDELYHGELFRTRAQELHKLQPSITSIYIKPDKLYNLSREPKQTALNSHGFFNGDYLEKYGEIVYVAMLNVAEKKAERTFLLHHDLVRDDPETYAIFQKILKDERYHVSYTSKFLKQWKKEGRGKEVKQALSLAHRSRLINFLARKGSKFGEFMGHAFLYIIYFTVIIPFAILAKLTHSTKGWSTPLASSKHTHSQY